MTSSIFPIRWSVESRSLGETSSVNEVRDSKEKTKMGYSLPEGDSAVWFSYKGEDEND